MAYMLPYLCFKQTLLNATVLYTYSCSRESRTEIKFKSEGGAFNCCK